MIWFAISHSVCKNSFYFCLYSSYLARYQISLIQSSLTHSLQFQQWKFLSSIQSILEQSLSSISRIMLFQVSVFFLASSSSSISFFSSIFYYSDYPSSFSQIFFSFAYYNLSFAASKNSFSSPRPSSITHCLWNHKV